MPTEILGNSDYLKAAATAALKIVEGLPRAEHHLVRDELTMIVVVATNTTGTFWQHA